MSRLFSGIGYAAKSAAAFVLIATFVACSDSSTNPTSPSRLAAGSANLDATVCTVNSGCSLATPVPTAHTGNLPTVLVDWPAVPGATDYQANCAVVSGVATCTGGGAVKDGATSATFTVSGDGKVQFRVHAHCQAGGGEHYCDEAHTVANGQNSLWGTATIDGGGGIDLCIGDCGGNTVVKTTPNITIVCTDVVYNGGAQTPCTGTSDDNETVTLTFSNNTNVGTGGVSGSTAGDDTHNPASASSTFQITPAATTLTGGSYSGTYDGASHSAGACSFSLNYGTDLSCTESPTSRTNAGHDDVVPSASGAVGNYTITVQNGSIDIAAANTTVNGGNGGGVYNGQTFAAGDCSISVNFNNDLSCSQTGSPAGPNVGNYPVVVSVSGATGNYNVSLVDGNIGITPASTLVTAGSGGGTYNGQTYSAGACSISVNYNNDLSCSNTSGSPAGPNVGTYPTGATASGATGNYTISYAPGSIVINPADIYATAVGGNRTYGQPNPTGCTVTGAVNGEIYTCTSSSTLAQNAPVGSTGTNVPAFDANPGLSNYTQHLVNATLTVVAYDLSNCYISPIYSVMPSTKSYQTKGSVLPIKCVIRDSYGNTVSNATGNLTITDKGTGTQNLGALNFTNAYRYTTGSPNLYMHQEDTSAPFYVNGHYYQVSTTWNDGSTRVGFFYIASK
jgi:hypothetical protein